MVVRITSTSLLLSDDLGNLCRRSQLLQEAGERLAVVFAMHVNAGTGCPAAEERVCHAALCGADKGSRDRRINADAVVLRTVICYHEIIMTLTVSR